MEKKFSEILKNAKLDFEIRKEEINLDKLYRELGKMVYWGRKENDKDDEFIDGFCDIISYKISIIKKMEKRAKLIKEGSKPKKKVKTKAQTKEKTKKVEKFIKPEQAPEPIVEENGFSLYKFCPKCQIGNNPLAEKCVYCGEKF